ncbi:MAG: nickel pincer cofactor biosynthesis protein LarC [Planctomycetota bacterium]
MARRGLYVQPFSGIAGDMFLAALLDLGLDLEALRAALTALSPAPFRLEPRTVMQGAVRATKLDVVVRRADGREVQEGREGEETGAGGHHHHHDHGPHHHGHDDHDHGHHHHGHGDHAHHHHEGGHHHHHHGHSHHAPGDPHGRSWREIREMIGAAAMPERARERALEIFRTLAGSEARIHGVAVEDVHFHEVGALDSILDICGAAIALDLLGIDEVVCDAIGVGEGTRRTAHGMLPVPTPATAEILRGLPLRTTGVADELVTPTGAAILRVLVDDYSPRRDLRILATGYGAGTTRRADPPNVLRVLLYEREESGGAEATPRRVAILEAQVDDMTPEALGFLRERLEEGGALDVLFQPVQMKKGRPGVALTVVTRLEDEDRLGDLLLRHSSSFGYRRREAERRILDREIVEVETPLGRARAKIGRREGRIVKVAAEYEDAARLARERDLPVAEVMAVIAAAVPRD